MTPWLLLLLSCTFELEIDVDGEKRGVVAGVLPAPSFCCRRSFFEAASTTRICKRETWIPMESWCGRLCVFVFLFARGGDGVEGLTDIMKRPHGALGDGLVGGGAMTCRDSTRDVGGVQTELCRPEMTGALACTVYTLITSWVLCRGALENFSTHAILHGLVSNCVV